MLVTAKRLLQNVLRHAAQAMAAKIDKIALTQYHLTASAIVVRTQIAALLQKKAYHSLADQQKASDTEKHAASYREEDLSAKVLPKTGVCLPKSEVAARRVAAKNVTALAVLIAQKGQQWSAARSRCSAKKHKAESVAAAPTARTEKADHMLHQSQKAAKTG